MRIYAAGLVLCASLFMCTASHGESIMGALDEIGNAANEANSAILNSLGKNNYEGQMAAYRRAEARRIQEISEASGVEPGIIRKDREEGATWEQIAQKYGVNLANLPSVEGN